MRRRQPLILAIDLGTSSVRTALFDGAARPIVGSNASRKYRVRYTPEHGAELDPATLLRATRAALRESLRLAKGAPDAISGSGFWHSLLGLDRAGKPLTPIYTWADARGTEDAARLRAEFDEHEIQQRTGCMRKGVVLAGETSLVGTHAAWTFPPCLTLGLARRVDFRKNLGNKFVQSLDGQRDGAVSLGETRLGRRAIGSVSPNESAGGRA